MSVNDKVRALRELNNWSQEEVAERMQINACRFQKAAIRDWKGVKVNWI